MNSISFQSCIGRSAVVVSASAYVATKLVADEIKLYVQETIAFYTSPQAKLVYRVAGQAVLWAVTAIAAVAFISGVKCREWADAYVQQCLTEAPTEAEMEVEAVGAEAISSLQFQAVAVIWAVERQLQLRARVAMVKGLARSVQTAWTELLATLGDRLAWS